VEDPVRHDVQPQIARDSRVGMGGQEMVPLEDLVEYDPVEKPAQSHPQQNSARAERSKPASTPRPLRLPIAHTGTSERTTKGIVLAQ
jgi:hypothetical protein